MVEVKTTGIEDTIKEFEKLVRDEEVIFKRTMYPGVKVVADYMRSQIKSLKTTKHYKAKGKRYATENEIKGLIESMGVTPIRKYGDDYDANVGFDGYNQHVRTKPANQKIANFINRGTSYMKAQPFLTRTKSATQAQAIEAMREAMDEEITKRTK